MMNHRQLTKKFTKNNNKLELQYFKRKCVLLINLKNKNSLVLEKNEKYKKKYENPLKITNEH